MNNKMSMAVVAIYTALIFMVGAAAQENKYLWPHRKSAPTIADRIAPPDSFSRIEIPPSSFGDWLRRLPLKPDSTPVLLFNKLIKRNQNAHYAVIDIDVGKRNFQQTGNAIIRLRGEYQYSRGGYDNISFWLTSGDTATFRNWIAGFRPVMEKNEMKWSNQGIVDSSYASFREYLDSVFTYSGSVGLARDVQPIDNPNDLQIGDFFLRSGQPGHATIIVDMAENKANGRKVALLAQSFMPAQSMYINRNLADSTISPWYRLDFGDSLRTPEWTYGKSDLRRFK